jgi:hypothetical protein
MFEKAESVATCQSEETCSAPEGDENVEEVAVNVNLLIVKPAVGYVIEGVLGSNSTGNVYMSYTPSVLIITTIESLTAVSFMRIVSFITVISTLVSGEYTSYVEKVE